MRIASTAALFSLLASAPAAFAQTPIPLTIDGNRALGTIMLQGGFTADLVISFENVSGLTPSSLAASAVVVDPADPSLRARLPGMVAPLDAFPVVLHIAPTNASNLQFHGVVDVELHTPNLHLEPWMPKSLFKAPDGAFFDDITTSEAEGSYRVCGSGGGFSEFLIVSDDQQLRQAQELQKAQAPLIVTVIVNKFVKLESFLTLHATSMPLLVYTTLHTKLLQARSLFDSGDLLGSIAKIASFSAYAQAHSGTDIPDLWQANNPSLVNV